MLNLTGIHKTYMMAGKPLHVVRGIDLSINKGEFVLIMGKSGSGKSTLLNIIGCLDIPSSGSYCFAGQNVMTANDAQLALIRNRHIGFIFQNFNLIARNTAATNVGKPLVYQGMSAKIRKIKTAEVLDMVGLSDRANHYPSQLSGGQQQRVAIARSLITAPKLIIADEPTGNLDSSTGKEIIQILRQLNHQGRTVVMVTHDSSLARKSDRIIEMVDGVFYS